MRFILLVLAHCLSSSVAFELPNPVQYVSELVRSLRAPQLSLVIPEWESMLTDLQHMGSSLGSAFDPNIERMTVAIGNLTTGVTVLSREMQRSIEDINSSWQQLILMLLLVFALMQFPHAASFHTIIKNMAPWALLWIAVAGLSAASGVVVAGSIQTIVQLTCILALVVVGAWGLCASAAYCRAYLRGLWIAVAILLVLALLTGVVACSWHLAIVSKVGIPAGTIQCYASKEPPAGWLKANGAVVSRLLHPDLFNAIGTRFGDGDNVTSFGLPDLRAGTSVDDHRSQNPCLCFRNPSGVALLAIIKD